MSDFSQQLIGRSGYLTDGFADIYDRFRPSPPDAVFEVLTFLAGVEQPKLVVDFGCGTGLASRAWAARADAVVGVEPNPRMIEQARERTREPSVRYVEAYAVTTTSHRSSSGRSMRRSTPSCAREERRAYG